MLNGPFHEIVADDAGGPGNTEVIVAPVGAVHEPASALLTKLVPTLFTAYTRYLQPPSGFVDVHDAARGLDPLGNENGPSHAPALSTWYS